MSFIYYVCGQNRKLETKEKWICVDECSIEKIYLPRNEKRPLEADVFCRAYFT